MNLELNQFSCKLEIDKYILKPVKEKCILIQFG